MVIMTSFMRFPHGARKRLWKLVRPRTHGVKVMLFNDDGEILLVRNSYGSTHLFVLPGGGVRPWEERSAAAERELREELGCAVSRLRPISTHFTAREGKRDMVYLFEGTLVGQPRPDGLEVVEASFFPLEELPVTISPATARRLAERRGTATSDGSW